MRFLNKYQKAYESYVFTHIRIYVNTLLRNKNLLKSVFYLKNTPPQYFSENFRFLAFQT
jgi:hypothetical protein